MEPLAIEPRSKLAPIPCPSAIIARIADLVHALPSHLLGAWLKAQGRTPQRSSNRWATEKERCCVRCVAARPNVLEKNAGRRTSSPGSPQPKPCARLHPRFREDDSRRPRRILRPLSARRVRQGIDDPGDIAGDGAAPAVSKASARLVGRLEAPGHTHRSCTGGTENNDNDRSRLGNTSPRRSLS